MSQISQEEKRYRGIGVAVAVVALLGWLFGAYFWSVANEAEERLAQHVALQGTAEEITQRIAILRDEADEALVIRDANAGERDTVTAELDQMRTDFTTLDEDTSALRSERETLQTELDQGRTELAEIETALAETENRTTQTTQELSDIGARLEAARQQEADLQATLSAMNAAASELTEQAAGAEERVQAARDAEASLEQRLQSARDDQDQIETARDALQQSVDTLSQQRDALAEDTLAAETQVQALQSMTSELTDLLAQRSADLQAIEARIGEMQAASGTTIRSTASGLALDTPYEHENTRAVFSDDGTFEMTRVNTDRRVTGRYSLNDGSITFDEVDGDTGSAEFPMTCAIAIADNGFDLQDDDGSCAVLDGVAFSRAGD